MGGKKKVAEYSTKELRLLGKYLQDARNSNPDRFSESRVNINGLQTAIQSLPKEYRELIEKFWGLTGGLNHNKKMSHPNRKDVAFNKMCREAHSALAKLAKLDFVKLYEESFDSMIKLVNSKINKKGLVATDELENVKYLMAFLVIFENGPKMSFEQDPMVVETKVDVLDYLDHYEALRDMCAAVSKFPDNSINLNLVKDLFGMMDLKDCVAVYKNFGIDIQRNISLDGVEGFQTASEKKAFLEEIEEFTNFGQIRAFKERVFKYGAWDVSCSLVLGYNMDLEPFWKEICSLYHDWSKISKNKATSKTLKTSGGIRELDVYNVGTLEFTDPYEIMTIYLERDLLAS